MGRVWLAQMTISDLTQPCLYQQYWLDKLWKVGCEDLTNLVHISGLRNAGVPQACQSSHRLVIFMAVREQPNQGNLRKGMFIWTSVSEGGVCDGRAKTW